MLGRHVTFPSPSREEIVRGNNGESLLSCGEDDPSPAFSGSRTGTPSHPDGVTKHGISGQCPPRGPRIVNATRSPCSVGSGEVKVTVDKHSGTWSSRFLDICTLSSGLTAGPDPIYSSGGSTMLVAIEIHS